MSKSKKRILAGIMSLLLIITSVFTGNVVTAKADEISEDQTINSADRYDNLVVKSGKTLTISGTTGESEPVVVTIGDILTVEEGGSVVASDNAVLELLDGATASGIDLYSAEGSLLSSEGTFTNHSGDFMAFDWDGTNSRWILHVESGDPSYDEFNPDKTNNLYMIELKNCNASCGSVSFGTTVETGKVNPVDENESKSLFQGSTVIISFKPIAGEFVDRIQIGTTEYRPGDSNCELPENMVVGEDEVFTYTTQESDFDEYGYLHIEVGFTGGGSGVNSYGKDDRLAFNIANSDKGNVFFQIGTEKYRVGGDDRFSESTIIDTLKDTEFAAAETITIWAENGDGVNVRHFDIRIAEKSVFGDDEASVEAKNAAQGESGYTFTVPDDYSSDKLIEFQIEFSTEESGGGDNDVTYDEDTTISSNLTMNDVTVNAGTLTIDGCSLRIDHKMAVNDSASIVGTSASSKLIFAGGAFSNGIALYCQDQKISGDNNNFSNNGDGPVEFSWNTTSDRWVTEQPPAEGGGEDFPWYTVSYGNSANLSTKNGKVYAERVHIGDITYSSIASEYDASDTDKIYSMKDTIFRQKTEEENNPDSGYEDPLMKYGIGGSDGDIFISKDVSGVSIDFKFIPDFGYQLTNIYTNENETDSLLNDFVAAKTVSSFTFNVIQGGNVHFLVKFEKMDNKVTGNAGIASVAKIESTNAAASGTLEMKVNNATASSDIPSGSEALATYDITLMNVVSKGGDRGSWDTPLEDLGENVATVTLPVDDTTNYTYSVIREHEGEEPVTLEATVADGLISFDTNKFSKYTIVKTPVAKSSIEKAEITLGTSLTYNGAAQTQTVRSVKIDDMALTASTDYTVSGNEKKDAGTYTLIITGTGNYTGTAMKEFTISKAAPTITLSNLSETTQAPSGVKAAISPEDATAAVVIEYQVEVSENGQITKQWVKERPAIAGTYPVRAYLPEGTTNLEAVTDANAVAGTYILTQYTTPTAPSGGSSGSLSGGAATETKQDGIKVETSTETKADGTKVDTTVETKQDGTRTETVVETAKDGTVKTIETVTNADGSSTKTEKETETNTKGKEVAITITTEKDVNGQVTGITQTSEIERISGSASATVTVEKTADGKITSAEAEVDKKGASSKLGVSATLFGSVVSQITEAAGTQSVEIAMTVTAGKKEYTVKADAQDITAGNKLKVMAIDEKTGNYVLVNAKTYTVSDAGNVKVTLPEGAVYQLMDTKEAAAIEKEILSTVKVKKTAITVEKGKKTSVQMSSKLDMDNVSKITYSTSKKSVATVSKSGKVTAKSAGTVTINVKVTLKNGKTKTVTMKVKVTQ